MSYLVAAAVLVTSCTPESRQEVGTSPTTSVVEESETQEEKETPEAPVAYFSANPTSGRGPLTVKFTDESSGNISSWHWDFGDDNISSKSNPSHTYTTLGLYSVELTVTGPGGSAKEIRNDYISVEEEEAPSDETVMNIISTAFEDGETIPIRYSCDDENISPALSWSGIPEGTQSFALILDDPDAPGGTFIHWVIFNIPGDTFELEEALSSNPELSNGIVQGRNDFGTIGYVGPCPPSGKTHRYFFILYALDQAIDLSAGVSKVQLREAMQGHIIAEAQLMCIYQSN